MNYVDSQFVIDELREIHRNGHDIEIDWLTGSFEPGKLASPRIEKSVEYWKNALEAHLASHKVDPARLASLKFIWPSGQRKFMLAVDDRCKKYKIHVNEFE